MTGFFFVCLLLKLIQIHYYTYFTCERTNRGSLAPWPYTNAVAEVKFKIQQVWSGGLVLKPLDSVVSYGI